MKIPLISNIINYRNEFKQMQKTISSMGASTTGIMDVFAQSMGYDGDKFEEGFGITKDFRVVNLKLLQYRSLQLITENAYAAMIFARLETKVINTGLTLNSAPIYEILNTKFDLNDEYLRGWARNTEARFLTWSRDKKYISQSQDQNFADLELMAYRTANLSGDCLVEQSLNERGLPVIRLIDGFHISSPLLSPEGNNNRIVQGVELNSSNKEVAYWVESGLDHVRIPAYGRGTGRRRAWLIKASKRRIDDVRGLPLLFIAMQNLNEANKYINAEQRAAVINSNLAMTRTRDKNQGPNQAGFRDRGSVGVNDKKTDTAGNVRFENQIPGLMFANLAPGETVESYDTKRPNVNFGAFMEATIKPISSSMEIPPESFFMEYKSNFSASRQANIDFNAAILKKIRLFSSQFNDNVYTEWFTGEVLNSSIEAPGFLDSLLSPEKYDVRQAWLYSTWRGLPNVSVDFKKQIDGLIKADDKGYITSEQIASQYFGNDFYDNLRRKKTEVEKLVEANAALYAVQLAANTAAVNQSVTTLEKAAAKIDSLETSLKEMSSRFDDIDEMIDDKIESSSLTK